MSLAHEVMETLLRLGVENGVVSSAREREVLLRFSNDRMTVADAVEGTTVSVFVRERGRKAGITLGETDASKVEAAVESMVAEMRRHGGGGSVPLPQGPFRYAAAAEEPPVDVEEMASMAAAAVEAARSAGATRSAGSFKASVTSLSMCTTAGAEGEALLPEAELSLRSFSPDGSSGHGLAVAADPRRIDAAAAGREAGGLARMSMGASEVKGGKRDAVLAPMVFADLAAEAGDMASAFYVDMGMSFLKDKEGKDVASPLLQLSDDPTIPGCIGTRPFDDEGSPTRRNEIIADGVLQGYLHNSETAHAHGVASTANAGLVAPRPFNLTVGAGKGGWEDLAAEMDRGLVVTNAWYLRYQNHAAGEFSVIPRDAVFVVEKGEVVGAAKGLRVSDTLSSLLSNIEALGGDRRWVRWWEVDVPTLSPSAWVRDVSFTRSTM